MYFVLATKINILNVLFLYVPPWKKNTGPTSPGNIGLELPLSMNKREKGLCKPLCYTSLGLAEDFSRCEWGRWDQKMGSKRDGAPCQLLFCCSLFSFALPPLCVDSLLCETLLISPMLGGWVERDLSSPCKEKVRSEGIFFQSSTLGSRTISADWSWMSADWKTPSSHFSCVSQGCSPSSYPSFLAGGIHTQNLGYPSFHLHCHTQPTCRHRTSVHLCSPSGSPTGNS